MSHDIILSYCFISVLTKQCYCYGLQRICEDTCKKNDSCKNTIKFIEKKCAIAKSPIHGYGLFSLENIKKGEYIIEYIGEIMDNKLENKRYYYNKPFFYKFELTDNIIIDALYMGNKARFINHSETGNVEVRNRYYSGCNRLYFFATKNIQIGEEISFDYNIKNDARVDLNESSTSES